MTVGGSPDGSLCDWREIQDAEPWQILLVGNGLSTNVWKPFGYESLLEQGARAELTDADRALFAGTTNFELVLTDLSTAIRVAEIAGMNPARLYVRYRSIQQALGRAVRQVHLARTQVPAEALRAIRSSMERFEWIFTTSYDLLIYWAMGYGGSYKPFKDFFRYGGRHEFDPERAPVFAGEIPVYYLHGALHLMVGGAGVTWKLRSSLQTILDQFGQPVPGDPQARPLLVTEGSAAEKLKAIESNDYLLHALGRLRDTALPTVVFGSRLGSQDDHLVEALSEKPRPIAISMRRRPKPELLQRQADLWYRLKASNIYFYDAATHPLGADDLAASLP
jgi:hypothetical protein